MSSAKLRLFQKRIENATRQGQIKAARELIPVIIDIIRIRTQLEGEGAFGGLDDLNERYVKIRERYKSNLDENTTPSKSNATATGQMINAMKGKASGTKITIDMKKGLRKKDLTGRKSKLTNNEVRKYYEERMGEWFALNPIEIEEAVNFAKEIIKDEIIKASRK